MFTCCEPRKGIVLFDLKDHQTVADGDAYIAALEELAARKDPVLLIMRVEGMTEQNHETRKRAALWFKQNRDRLSEFAYGVIRVEGTPHPEHAQEVENSNFARMLPFPLRHANSLEEAFVMAENWLSAEG